VDGERVGKVEQGVDEVLAKTSSMYPDRAEHTQVRQSASTPDLAARHLGDGLRHCERSEAIQNLSAEAVWIASLHRRKIASQFVASSSQ